MARDGTFSLSRVLETGLAAGLVFAVFQVVAALVLNGPAETFTPLRMIAAMALGPAALDPSHSLLVAATVGVVVHLGLSMIFAVVFAALIPVTFGTGPEVGLGMAFGFMLWLTNFYLLGPSLGWIWFAEQTSPIVQLGAHTIAFGGVLGWLRRHLFIADEAKVDEELRAWHALN
jgi:hypothetical protein